MNEELLYSLRREPPPAFADRLRARLRDEPSRRPSPRFWIARQVAAAAAAVLIVGALFAVPGVRASAQSFLALFREVNFVALPVDPARIDRAISQLDPERLIGNHVQVLEAPGPPVAVTSPAAASAAAGLDVRVPQFLPERTVIARIDVHARRSARLIGDTAPLQQVMDTLGIRDIEVPPELQGQIVTIAIPPVVAIKYEESDLRDDQLKVVREATLLQARTPDVTMQDGSMLPRLAEIGLRILGLPADEAERFAHSVDWTTTFLVPIPPTASRFQQVDVGGAKGLFVEGPLPAGVSGQSRGNWNLLLWSEQGRMFAIQGTFRRADVMTIANSLR